MRPLVLSVAATALLSAQSTVTTYRADTLNGGFSASSSSTSTDHTQSQTASSINGNTIPLEQHQERVIRSDANGSVSETVIRRYDPTGQFASTERVVTEMRKTPNGGSIVEATTYRSDINGTEQPSEHSVATTSVSGTTTTTDTVVERSGVNGTFQPVEKRQDVTRGTGKEKTTDQTIYRTDSSGGFREAGRKVIVQTQSGNQSVEDATSYGPGVDSGSLQFQERRVSTSVTAPDGAQSTTVDIYSPSADGHARDADSKPQLNQQQIITRVKNPDGTTVETFSVREPNITDANQLGPAREISKTLCTGNCGASATPAPGTALPGSTAGTAQQSKP